MNRPPPETYLDMSAERCIGTSMVIVVKETPEAMMLLAGRDELSRDVNEMTWGDHHVSVAANGAGDGLGLSKFRSFQRHNGEGER